MAATNKWDEFKLHIEGALNNKCNLYELKELFLQITLYCGVPTGNECFKIAMNVFKENTMHIHYIYVDTLICLFACIITCRNM